MEKTLTYRPTTRALAGLLGIAMLMLVQFPQTASAGNVIRKPVNKLLYMYRFFYLPFSVDFRQGSTPDEVLPYIKLNQNTKRLIKAEELKKLDDKWEAIRKEWKKRSLILKTKVALKQSIRISRQLRSHIIPITRGAFDGVSLDDRIKIRHALKSYSKDVRVAFTQLRFLKSFLAQTDETNFNFFVIGPDWCQSTREYRAIFEGYIKAYPNKRLTLHSVTIRDPKEEVFDSGLMKTLFPHVNKYTHESVPRFLALEYKEGKTLIYEEGEALKVVYDRFFKSKKGFLNKKTKLFKNHKKSPRIPPLRFLSSAGK